MSGCASTVSRCWRSSRAISRLPTALALPSTTWATMHAPCATCRRPAAGSPQVRGGVGASEGGREEETREGVLRAERLQGVLYPLPHVHSLPIYSLHTHTLIHSPAVIRVHSPVVPDIHPTTSHLWSLTHPDTFCSPLQPLSWPLTTSPPPPPKISIYPSPLKLIHLLTNPFTHSPIHSPFLAMPEK